MRAFVAIVPPAEVIEHLSEFLAPRRAPARGPAAPPPRWTRDEQLHITCAFLPDLAERDVDELVDRLGEAVAGRGCGPLWLSGADAFPDAIAARVLALAVEPAPARDALGALAGSVRRAANGAGVRVRGGPYRPHLTVARFGRPTEATRWLRILETYGGLPWQPTRVELIRSHLGQGPGGTPRYETLESLPLS